MEGWLTNTTTRHLNPHAHMSELQSQSSCILYPLVTNALEKGRVLGAN